MENVVPVSSQYYQSTRLYFFYALMLFLDYNEVQNQEHGLDDTEIEEDTSLINRSCQHELVCVTLQNYDTSLGPFFHVLSSKWRR